jgi:hypothetical protein
MNSTTRRAASVKGVVFIPISRGMEEGRGGRWREVGGPRWPVAGGGMEDGHGGWLGELPGLVLEI